MNKPREFNKYPEDKQKIFQLLRFKDGDIKVIGTGSLRGQIYYADYDLDSIKKYKSSSLERVKGLVWNEFKDIYKELLDDDNVFIIEFKNGKVGDEKVTWNYEELKKGYKLVNNKRFNFEDGLENGNTKIDLIVYINGQFEDINATYNIYYNKNNPISEDNPTSDDINLGETMKTEAKEKYQEKHYMKYLKRLYSYFRIIKNDKGQELLNGYFNGDLGRLYKCYSNFEILEILFNNVDEKRLTKWFDEIDNFAQEQKLLLSNVIEISIRPYIYKEIDSFSNSKSYTIKKHKLKLIVQYLEAKVNYYAKKIIENNNILSYAKLE